MDLYGVVVKHTEECVVWGDGVAVRLATAIVGIYALTLPISQRHPVHLMFAAINLFCSTGLDDIYMTHSHGNYSKMIIYKLAVALVNIVAFFLSRMERIKRGKNYENKDITN